LTAVTPTQRDPRGWDVAVTDDALRIAREGRGDCTAWRSTTVPPPTIRVWRQDYGPAAGTVQVVPLREWAEHVLRTEMPAYYPTEALKANAIFVKQYGWYYTINWRGGFAPDGNCYDVRDVIDGFYRPEVYTPAPQHLEAQAATWPYSLRKYDSSTGTSRMFLTGYRAGAFVECGTDSDGWHLFQHSAHDCGRDGHTWEGIMRKYVEPRLQIVDPGSHDLLGDIRGDAGVLTPRRDSFLGRTYRASGAGFHDPGAPTIRFPQAGYRGSTTGDVNGDRLEDLIVFSDGASGPTLRVHRAGPTGYTSPVTFWTDATGVTRPGTRLISDDFDGDGLADAALLVPTTSAGSGDARLLVLTSRGTTSFNAPATWWSGQLDTTKVVPYAADANGDGRSDVILERTLNGERMQYLVMESRLMGGALGGPASWLVRDGVRRATTRTVIADVDRDGRDDVVVVTPLGTGTTMTVLRASTSDTFAARTLWTSPSSAPLDFADVKVGGGDFNNDGRGDVLLLVDLGAGNGTRFDVFVQTDTGGTMSTWRTDPGLIWSDARLF
jgi:hypothetical protein